MRYISPFEEKILANRLKIGRRSVNVRVEVDKYVYTPNLTTEIDYVSFWTDNMNPEVVGEITTSSAFMISPVKGISFEKLRISSDFAVLSVNGKQREHPIDHKKRDHEGVDFDVGEGTELVAVADGVVTKVNVSGLRYVNILHTNGIMTRYLHMGEMSVAEGDKVIQGQIIGKVGPKDAYSTGPHLHFEVRVNATKNSMGSPRDPKDYLSGNAVIAEVPSVKYQSAGFINTDNTRLRAEPLVSSETLVTLNKDDFVMVKGRVGEWYNVMYGSTEGYVYGKYVTIDSSNYDTDTGNDGVNPTYQEIVNYITQYANSIGLPARIACAIAWTESGMRQFREDGTPVRNVNSPDSIDWGMMQLNDKSWSDRYDFDKIKSDWKYNVRAGLDIALNRYNEAKRLNEPDIARATYSGYNSWSNIDRYRTENDPRDINFANYYNAQPWLSKIKQGIGGSAMVGIVTGLVVNIRSTPDVNEDDNVISQVSKGMTLETLGLEGEWYKVILSDGKQGYIHQNYFKIISENITTDFQVNNVFKDDFEKYTLYSIPPMTRYLQDKDKLWKIMNDGVSNTLCIKGGGMKSNEISFVVNLLQTGKLTLSYKTQLSDGNTFTILDNELVVFSASGNNNYSEVTIPLLAGSHVIKFVRNKVVDGNDTIHIDNVAVYEFVYKEIGEPSLANVDQDVTVLDSITINADGVAIYDTPSFGNVIQIADKGAVFGGKVMGNICRVLFDDGSYGYIDNTKDVCVIVHGGWKRNQLRVKTGGFIYERTLTLSDIESINIDARYDLRAASATIVLSNPNGRLSPDYNPMKFPERGVIKSPFVEYYDGDPLGVLTENTPIRIYLGYGDNPPRKFTGLIDSVDIDGENHKITIKCTDMMKKLNSYTTYKELMFPPNGETDIGWLTSSVIHELASIAGLSGWRTVQEDLNYPDIFVEETYYVDVNPEEGVAMVMDELGNPYAVQLSSLAEEDGYLNPNIVINKIIPRGSVLADEIDKLCQDLNYWQRCDVYGTYRCVPVEFNPLPVAYFKDTENIITLNKTIDYTNTRNHIIVVGAGEEEHFFDKELWRAVNGVRKTMQINVPWADTHGKRRTVAIKAFNDMKMNATTISVAVEGNPYIDLLDTVGIEHANTTTKDSFVIKGIKDSWSSGQGYITYLDLFRYEGSK